MVSRDKNNSTRNYYNYNSNNNSRNGNLRSSSSSNGRILSSSRTTSNQNPINGTSTTNNSTTTSNEESLSIQLQQEQQQQQRKQQSTTLSQEEIKFKKLVKSEREKRRENWIAGGFRIFEKFRRNGERHWRSGSSIVNFEPIRSETSNKSSSNSTTTTARTATFTDDDQQQQQQQQQQTEAASADRQRNDGTGDGIADAERNDGSTQQQEISHAERRISANEKSSSSIIPDVGSNNMEKPPKSMASLSSLQISSSELQQRLGDNNIRRVNFNYTPIEKNLCQRTGRYPQKNWDRCADDSNVHSGAESSRSLCTSSSSEPSHAGRNAASEKGRARHESDRPRGGSVPGVEVSQPLVRHQSTDETRHSVDSSNSGRKHRSNNNSLESSRCEKSAREAEPNRGLHRHRASSQQQQQQSRINDGFGLLRTTSTESVRLSENIRYGEQVDESQRQTRQQQQNHHNSINQERSRHHSDETRRSEAASARPHLSSREASPLVRSSVGDNDSVRWRRGDRFSSAGSQHARSNSSPSVIRSGGFNNNNNNFSNNNDEEFLENAVFNVPFVYFNENSLQQNVLSQLDETSNNNTSSFTSSFNNNNNKNNNNRFNGATIAKKRNVTKIARGEDLKKYPLHVPKAPMNQKVNMKKVAEMLKPEYAAAFQRAIDAQTKFGGTTFTSNPRRSMDFSDEDASKAAGIRFIDENDPKELKTRGEVCAKTVIEHRQKTEGRKSIIITRRRLVVHPQQQNDYAKQQLKYKPIALDLPPVSELASDVWAEGAISGDGDSAFYQIPLPREVACFYRGRTQSGRLFECTTFLMGHTSSCEVCQLITAAGVGDSKYVKEQYSIDRKLKPRIWIDGFNIVGDESLLLRTAKIIKQNCNSISFKLKDEIKFEKRYEFVGIEFHHERNKIRPAFKTRQQMIEPLEIDPKAGKLEQHVGRMVFCSQVNRIALVKYWFPMKSVRRYLNKLNNNTITPDSKCLLSKATWAKLEMWRKECVQWYKVERISGRGHANLFVDASSHGWGAVLMLPTGKIMVIGKAWTTEELPAIGERLNISKLELRGVGHAVKTFKSILLQHELVTIHVDNTSTMHNIRRGTCRSEAMAIQLLQFIDSLESTTKWKINYIASKNNPADTPSRKAFLDASSSSKTRFGLDSPSEPSVAEKDLRALYDIILSQASLAHQDHLRRGADRVGERIVISS